MNDRAKRLLQEVGLGWSDEEGRLLRAALDRRFLSRARWRRAGGALGLAAVACAGILVFRWTGVRGDSAPGGIEPRPALTPSAASAVRTVRFEDGSTVVLLDAASSLGPREVTPRRTVVDLLAGGAKFDVVAIPSRLFRVEAGDVAIEVLGTSFLVERLDRRARVSVDRGRIRASWTGGSRELAAGEAATFPPETAAAPAADSRSPVADSRPAQSRAVGDRAPMASGPAAVTRDEPAELLAIADAARLAGHHERALAPLRRVIDRYSADQRAPQAAFMLGRILLDHAGRPAEAAAAFERARRLDPDGVLAEDALAREVAARVRAGDAARARALAAEYRRRYPGGRRLRSVEQSLEAIAGSE